MTSLPRRVRIALAVALVGAVTVTTLTLVVTEGQTHTERRLHTSGITTTAGVEEAGTRIDACENTTEPAHCFVELAEEFIAAGAYQTFASAVDGKPAELEDRCAVLLRTLDTDRLLATVDPVALVTQIDTPVCNGSAAEFLIGALGPRLDPDGWSRVAAACIDRVPQARPGKTTACARGIGWALARSGIDPGQALQRCRELIDAAVTSTGRDWVTDDIGRYSYGCGHGTIMARHAPYADAKLRLGTDRLVATCVALRADADRHALSLRSGCSGGLGSALGQGIAAAAGNTASVTPDDVVAALRSCLSLLGEQADERYGDTQSPEWQCVHQVYRQNAWLLFDEEAELFCRTQAELVSEAVAQRCESEAARWATDS